MVDDKDLEALARFGDPARCPRHVDGNTNTDGTAWMYAVAGLHPLWTHCDYP